MSKNPDFDCMYVNQNYERKGDNYLSSNVDLLEQGFPTWGTPGLFQGVREKVESFSNIFSNL